MKCTFCEKTIAGEIDTLDTCCWASLLRESMNEEDKKEFLEYFTK